MANIPAWFNVNDYMANKLAQLQATDPDGNWTAQSVAETFVANGFDGPEGAYNHFVQYGMSEDLAPNSLFDASQYYAAKAAEFYGKAPSEVSPLDIATVKGIIHDAGMNAWSHYQQYGSNEGVNPSNDFDSTAYMEAKLALMQKDDPKYTMEQLESAFAENGYSALTHYLTYKGQDGEVAANATFPVPVEDQVNTEVEGKTFTLTSAMGEQVIGTNGNDTFKAVLGNEAVNSTLNTGDVIDGKGGTDTLDLIVDKGTSLPAGIDISNIENVNITNGVTSLTALDAKVFSGVQVLTLKDNATAITVSNLEGVTLGVAGEATAAVTGDFGGTATSADLLLSGAQGSVTLTGAAVETVNISGSTLSATDTVTISGTAVTGAANKVVNISATGAMNLDISAAVAPEIVVNGTGDVDLGTLNAVAKSVDAGKAEGDITLTGAAALQNVTTGAGDDDITLGANLAAKGSVVTGAGDDLVDLATFNVAAGATINLGAGDDVLLGTGTIAKGAVIDGGEGVDSVSTALINAGNAAQFVNFEELSLSNTTLDVNLLTGSTITGITIDDMSGDGGLTNVATSMGLTVNADNGHTVTLGFKDVAGTDDAYTVTFSAEGGETAATAENIDAGTLVIQGIENVTIDSGSAEGFTSNTIKLTDAAATSLTLIGDQALDVSFTAFGTAGDGKGVSLIDGSFATGDLTIDTANVNAVSTGLTLKAGSGDDEITLAQKATVNAGAGDDTIIAAAAGGTFTGGEGKDTFDIALALGKDAMTTITDFAKGDTLTFADKGTETFTSKMVDVSSAKTFGDALNLAAAGDGGTNGIVTWFQYGGNTYMVEDMSSGNTFGNDDMVVKLAGTVDLSQGNLAGVDFSLA